MPDIGVNLPRWGLKHFPLVVKFPDNIECKFTPLGFETACKASPRVLKSSV